MRQGLNAQQACEKALFTYLERVNNEPEAISLIALDAKVTMEPVLR